MSLEHVQVSLGDIQVGFQTYLSESQQALAKLGSLEPEIAEVIEMLWEIVRENRNILICGNGGSAADSQHMATELVCRFEANRAPIRAIALTTDTSMLTAVSNDFAFADIFSRQVEAHGNNGDALIAFSTSGNSENVLKAAQTARSKGIKVIALTGQDGGRLAGESDILLAAPSKRTAIVQQLHQVLYHYICSALEQRV